MSELQQAKQEELVVHAGLSLCRARLDDGRRVLVKSPIDHFAGADARQQLAQEFAVAKSLDHPNLARAVELRESGPKPALLLEDPGGPGLQEVLREGALPLRRALEIGLGLAQALSDLHRQDIVHRALRPECVLINELQQPCIVDFSRATRVTRQQAALIQVDQVQAGWHYISPEQTGRTSRAVDYRTDLYSLGIILYELLSGERPFRSERPLELLHDHLAVRPSHLCSVRTDLPRVVGDLVARLLEKDPDDRYRGAVGLVQDLERILDRVVRGLSPKGLELEGVSLSTRFQLPDRLYGRSHETQALEHAFESARQGRQGLMLIHGYSGIGKTSLIDALRAPVVAAHGYMASGKFDPLDRGSAYQAVTAAFHDLVQQFLTEDEASIESLRAELLDALGENAGVLVDLVPQMDVLLGRVDRPVRLEANAERHRMHHVVAQFLSALARPDRPIVLVLDDLQWADTATLDFMEMLATTEDGGSLLLLGAYRDNEVDASHPLRRMLQRLEDAGLPAAQLPLEALADDAVAQMVADALGRSLEDAEPLTRLCITRTGSNPFYIRLFLNSLYEDELLQLDPASGAWSWDMERLSDRQLTENMADLALKKIEGLAPEVRDCLGLMALVGAEGDLALLTEVRGGRDPLPLLQEMAALELIILTEQTVSVLWKWSHDRIQEAAFRFVNEAERLEAHRRIGEVLQRRLQLHDRRVSLFSVLRHRNAVVEGSNIVDVDLARLNADGGDAAMHATGYEAALAYFATGIGLLGEQQWLTQGELAFRLHIGAADAARLATRYEEMYRWLKAIDHERLSVPDRVRARLLEILYLSHSGKNLEAVKIARQTLAMLGWKLPEKPGLPRVLAGLVRTRWRLRKLPVAEMALLPVMHDETAISTMKVLSESLSAAYFADPLVMGLMIQKAMRLSADHGNTASGSHMYAAYGMVLSAIVRKPELGLKYANLAVELAERFGTEAHPSRVRFIRDTLVGTATTPLRDIESSLEKAYAQGMEAGDMGFATGALFFLGLHRLLCGNPLDALEPELEAANAMLKRHAQQRNLNAAVAQLQFVHDIRHGPAENRAFTGPHVEGDTHLLGIDRMATAWTLIFRAMSRHHLGENEGALSDLRRCSEFLDSIIGQALVPVYHLYAVLIACAAKAEGRPGTLKLARANLKKLAWFAGHNPGEHLPALLLANAVLAGARGKSSEALKQATDCIELAQQRGLPLIAALAAEQVARVHEAQQSRNEANAWREDARAAYERWGADFLARHTGREAVASAESPEAVDLDLETVVTAAEAISEQIQLDGLLERLVQVTMQNAGAERGVLFRIENGQSLPEAEGRLKPGSSTIDVRMLEPDFKPSVAASVVRLVARTAEPVLSARAVDDDRLSADPVVQQHGVRSLLCLPLLNQGRLQGILYLENNQVDGAFTQERFRLLRVLSSQAASALEKARLLDSQHKLIQAQNKFVPAEFITTLGHQDLFEVELGEGTLRDVDILFTDIRGFTSIVEHMSPGEAMEFINDYLSHMEPAVLEHGGFIDKYIGDAILALFDGASQDAGIRAGIAMAAAERADNERRAAAGLPPILTGIGINTDAVMMGIVGGPTSLRATIIGDAVNLASRLESLTKRYSTRMLVSENTARRIHEDTPVTLRPLEWLQVVGKTEPTLVFEVIEALDPETQDVRLASLDDFRAAHKCYEAANLREARERFSAILAQDPGDAAAQVLLDRTNELLALDEPCTGPPITRLEKK